MGMAITQHNNSLSDTQSLPMTVLSFVKSLCAGQRRQMIRLPCVQEEAEFFVGNISTDMSFTHSRCLFEKNYHLDPAFLNLDKTIVEKRISFSFSSLRPDQ